MRDIGAHRPRQTLATLRPATLAGVQEIARRSQPVWPVSTGRNWGLGSRIPPADGYSVVDLSRMTAIRALDTARGIAVIEPGVTQAQLARAVNGTGWMVNLTGSCAQTSIVGNTLAGGDGVIRPRGLDVTGLEAVTANGAIVTAGSLHAPPGPGTHALQAPAAAIVTAMAVRLVRPPPTVQLVHARVAAGACVEAVTALRQCLIQGLCGAMPRVFGGRVLVPALGTAAGTQRRAAAAARILRDTAGISAVRVVPASPRPPARDPLRAVADLLTGQPTCAMVWEAFGLPCEDLDARAAGWLVVLPLLALTGGQVARAAAAWRDTSAQFGIPVTAEIIVVSPETAHGVIQICFPRQDKARAHALRDALIGRLAGEGMALYRAGIDQLDQVGAGPAAQPA
jgi:4-cresol dehydrogenase (hydroxylating)